MDTPGSIKVSAIKLNEEAVTKTGNWTCSSGTLTVKKEYLSTLENGEYDFTVVLTDGDILTLTITVGA